jgi:beta-phosphoglucomutase-like phosphatase (HAD superfamily)
MNTQQGSFKAVVFDVDGTLIDSVDVHAQAWVDAFAEFGHEIRFGDVRRQIGKGRGPTDASVLDKGGD